MKRIFSLVAALSAVVLLAALVWRLGWKATEIPEEGPIRVVSLAPSVTEILFALGAGESVVGVTDRCDYPAQVDQVERIGAFGKPSMEKLLALDPDLVIATGLERADVTDALRHLGIRVVWVKTGNFEELFQAIQEIGQEVEKPQNAEQLVATMLAELDAAVGPLGPTPADRRPRVFVEIWNRPITTAGRNSFVDQIIDRAGGVNVAGELDEAYPTINPEKILEWNPDVIVLCYMNSQSMQATVKDRIGWDEINAVRKGNLVADIPAEFLLRPGPRLTKGVKALRTRLQSISQEETAR